jgi:DNA topoisomerase-1
MSPNLPIRRLGSPPGFRYTHDRKGPLRNPDQLSRIKSLAIPPAWKDVHIADSDRSRLQATGIDARGRKQYRYSPHFREQRELQKFARMPAFADALPHIRSRARQDLRKPGLPREKVLAAIVLILDQTFIRIGSDEYAKANHSYGLTTLEDRHAHTHSSHIVFDFKGKSGVRHHIDLADPRLAEIVHACRDLPGSQLFQYKAPDGVIHDVKAADVNAYLKHISGSDFTAKDFRTWAGTALACALLRRCETCNSKHASKRKVAETVRRVARTLGNTPAVCRKSYIHPHVIDAYIAGTLTRTTPTQSDRDPQGRLDPDEEAEVRRLLQSPRSPKSRPHPRHPFSRSA